MNRLTAAALAAGLALCSIAPARAQDAALDTLTGVEGEGMFGPLGRGRHGAGHRPLAGLGLGWAINDATARMPLLIQKTGGFSGFLTYAALAPGRGLGAFLVVNRLDLPVFFTLMEKVNDLLSALAPR